MTLLMILQLLIVLGALWVGSRYGSLALGAISGIGLAILVFGFSMKPGTPPTDVIYIIIAAVTCAGRAATAQASRPYHLPGSAMYVLSDRARGYRTCGIHFNAHHLRHCAQKGHSS